MASKMGRPPSFVGIGSSIVRTSLMRNVLRLSFGSQMGFSVLSFTAVGPRRSPACQPWTKGSDSENASACLRFDARTMSISTAASDGSVFSVSRRVCAPSWASRSTPRPLGTSTRSLSQAPLASTRWFFRRPRTQSVTSSRGTSVLLRPEHVAVDEELAAVAVQGHVDEERLAVADLGERLLLPAEPPGLAQDLLLALLAVAPGILGQGLARRVDGRLVERHDGVVALEHRARLEAWAGTE
mmetsp:Transcript_12927/g.44114  ORF Transcript_12927/g.44114 Transcript_12927/m.44114 type:complete len:241 (+) Transcript_12927:266-988(+)